MVRASVLEELPSLIKLCFGEADLTFCTSTREEKNASELLFTARTNDLTFNEVRSACKSYLESRGALKVHIEKELEKIDCYYCSLQKEN